ncbi:MAG: DEAD/DEAH box helicase family protein [Proteobacteria bacterium]|nr:DEAD/DEAH box helicase family protein [Pseudomonadota bacterium]
MSRVYLQEMVDDIRFDGLPVNWNAFDIGAFSHTKTLWDYQRKAVENAIKALWKYYEDFHDYQTGENADANRERKQKFFKWYRNNGLDEPLDIPLPEAHKLTGLLGEYYTVADGKISYEQFINRACFWMATGSGKTLVLVKLIEVLRGLIQRGEIPPHDILILSCRNDLIDQLKKHVHEFNAARSDLFIHLRELREYADAKRHNPTLFKEHELTVFYYRSDNLSDEQKERIIDFRNYDDGGKWYVLLDEAHKGDREESKRQHIYSILSRNGFLFNFSATFTDARDLTTTVYNFNLSEFIKAGYGKHIAILQQELRAFRDEDDYSNEEKQKIVLKSLLMLAYARKYYEKLRRVNSGLYHKPLSLTLVNSVNTEEADLQLFFRELERIGKGETSKAVWNAAKDELWKELRQQPAVMFEDGEKLMVDEDVFEKLEQKDLLQAVYNARSPGEIEILIRPSNKQELAFKLRTSERPFALIKIGDISGWLKDKLAGYEIVEGFEDEGFFEGLNADDSDINILMGSRSFYEGWDSNRPNVINFINIGVGADARKFILQAVGRGVRIEPLKNWRKRLLPLHNANEVAAELFEKVKDKVAALEMLIIFGTNRQALQTVIEHLNQESRKRDFQQLALFKNPHANQHELLIPVYRLADKPMVQHGDSARFEIEPSERQLLKKYVSYVDDDRVIMALYDAEPQKVGLLKDSVEDMGRFYKDSGRCYRNVALLVRRIFDYFGVIPQEFERLKPLQDEIRHFKNIQVSLKNISDLTEKIEVARHYTDPATIERELDQKLEKKEITLKDYKEGIKQAARMVRETQIEYSGKRLKILHVANHYYIPMILSGETERIEYIKHIVQTPSEIKFLNYLEDYLAKPGNRFKDFDWWIFSKLDESLDEVYIPYYDGTSNKVRDFKPDFIFWFQKGNEYFIVFIDPKGTEHTDYQRKIDGYSAIFEGAGGAKKPLSHNGKKVFVYAFLHTADKDGLPAKYREYWFDNVGKILTSILAAG